jgi:hypothetical protein
MSVILDHIDTGDPWSWIRVIQKYQQVTEEGIGFPCASDEEPAPQVIHITRGYSRDHPA